MSELLATLNIKEQEYRNKGPLYVNTEYISFNNLRQFLLDFLVDYNENNCTYYTKNLNNTQCYSRCYRSAGDIFRIILSYIENITLAEVVIELVDIVENYISDDGNYCIKTIKCNDIGKRVYYSYNDGKGKFTKPSWYGSQNIDLDLRVDEFEALPEDYLALAI